MNTNRAKKILEETGGDCYYADVFLEAALEAAALNDVEIEDSFFEFFHREIERHRQKRNKRQAQNQ
jgi:hypothetical protein